MSKTDGKNNDRVKALTVGDTIVSNFDRPFKAASAASVAAGMTADCSIFKPGDSSIMHTVSLLPVVSINGTTTIVKGNIVDLELRTYLQNGVTITITHTTIPIAYALM